MNIQRSSIVTASAREILQALKLAYPTSMDIQAIPDNLIGVKFESAAGYATFTTTRVLGTADAGRA